MKYLTKILLISFLLLFSFKLIAQDAKFQSLIIYNLTKLLDWPDKTGNFTIKILGNTELVKELKEFTSDRKAGGRQDFDIQKADISNIGQCQMLFVGSSDCENIDQIIKSVGLSPILVITEKPDLTAKGAGISFVKIDGAWKFQYKEDIIKKSGIKVSLDFKELGIAK
jgi:hypothetical protein